MIIDKTPRVVREMVKYGIVGAASTVFDFAFLNLSSKLLGDAKSLLWLAVAVGYSAGTLVAYWMNSRWTFRYDTKGKEARKLGQFAIVSAIAFGLTELIVLTLVHKYNMDKNIAKLASVFIVFFWNFTANKLWTFRRPRAAKP